MPGAAGATVTNEQREGQRREEATKKRGRDRGKKGMKCEAGRD